jgi:LmbE family N-acetylglucosaminyl deacetylase
MRTASPACPVFLSPHFDDVALSCGGTVAGLGEDGARPLIVTCFGESPAGRLSDFAQRMHERWQVDAETAIAIRRAEEAAAAALLGGQTQWLDFPDAIYRGERYTSDEQLFGSIHPAESDLPGQVKTALAACLEQLGATPSLLYVLLGIGNHVDHQHVGEVGRRSAQEGYEVGAYEDFPYAGDPGSHHQAHQITGSKPAVRELTPELLERRVRAILCY